MTPICRHTDVRMVSQVCRRCSTEFAKCPICHPGQTACPACDTTPADALSILYGDFQLLTNSPKSPPLYVSNIVAILLDLFEAAGISNVSALPGCLEYKVNDEFTIIANGHKEPVLCSKGTTVHPFHFLLFSDDEEIGFSDSYGNGSWADAHEIIDCLFACRARTCALRSASDASSSTRSTPSSPSSPTPPSPLCNLQSEICDHPQPSPPPAATQPHPSTPSQEAT
jgi:hypothetical protein